MFQTACNTTGEATSSKSEAAASSHIQLKASSKNDIFSTSWKTQAPPPSAPLPITPNLGNNNPAGLSRSRTTGALLKLRKARRLGIENLELGETPFVMLGETQYQETALQNEESMTPRAIQGPLVCDSGYATWGEEWSLHHYGELCGEEVILPTKSITRTTSFFNLAPAPPSYIPESPTSPSSTSSHSLYSTTTASNPSLTSLHVIGSEGQASLGATHVRPTWDEALEVKTFQDERFLLGAGRYASVYLGSYRMRGEGIQPGSAETDFKSPVPVRVCAIKILEKDAESHRLGMREASLLSHLASERLKSDHPGRKYLVSLLGVKHELEPETIKGSVFTHTRSSSLPELGSILTHSSVPPGRELARRTSLEGSLNAFAPSIPSLHLVLSYAPTTLADVLHNHPQLITAPTYLRIGLQLAQALSFLHSRQILHTDLKSHNVLLTADLEVRLADFNTALHLPSLPGPLLDPIGLGTPVYSPPEFNKSPPSPFGYPADVWAFGVVMMAVLVGREPYASLVSGRRSRTSGRSHELRLWLVKGAYWAWEEQERLEAFETRPSPTNETEVSTHDPGMPRFGRDELKLLGIEDKEADETLRCWRLSRPFISTTLCTDGDRIDLRPYDDGSPPLFYPGARHVRAPQRILTLLRTCCSVSADSRPTIHEIRATLEKLQDRA